MANILPHNSAGGGIVCQVGVETVETKDDFSTKEQKEKPTEEQRRLTSTRRQVVSGPLIMRSRAMRPVAWILLYAIGILMATSAIWVGRAQYDTNQNAIDERDNLLSHYEHVPTFREPKGDSRVKKWRKPHTRVPGRTRAESGPYRMSQRGAPPAHPSGGCVLQARTSVVNKTANAAATFLEEIKQKTVISYHRPVRGSAGKAVNLTCATSMFLHQNLRDKRK